MITCLYRLMLTKGNNKKKNKENEVSDLFCGSVTQIK